MKYELADEYALDFYDEDFNYDLTFDEYCEYKNELVINLMSYMKDLRAEAKEAINESIDDRKDWELTHEFNKMYGIEADDIHEYQSEFSIEEINEMEELVEDIKAHYQSEKNEADAYLYDTRGGYPDSYAEKEYKTQKEFEHYLDNFCSDIYDEDLLLRYPLEDLEKLWENREVQINWFSYYSDFNGRLKVI